MPDAQGRPCRIQRRRTKGWRTPAGAVYVGRPSKWANPFPIDSDWTRWAAVAFGYRADKPGRRAFVVAAHRSWVLGEPIVWGPLAKGPADDLIGFTDGFVPVRQVAMGIAAWAADSVFADQRPRLGPPPTLEAFRAELGGRDVLCWCGLDELCHGDTCLELANP